MLELNDKLQKQTISSLSKPTEGLQPKKNECKTSDVSFKDSFQSYKEHHKSEWHKHKMKHKTRQLPPFNEDRCLANTELNNSVWFEGLFVLN